MMAKTRQEIEENIVDLVKDCWTREQRAYHLTTLGSVLARQDRNYTSVIGMKLRPFVEIVMGDRLRFISHNRQPLVYGVVPIDADLPTNTDDLFIRPRRPERTIFDRVFWNAFAKPLFEGKRVVELHRSGDDIVSFSVRELPEQEPLPEDAFEIPADQIVGSDLLPGPERSRKVYDSVQVWLAANSVDQSVFRSQLSYREGPEARTQSSDLVRALETFDKSDQERIHIPLDIVIKLLRRT